MLSIMHAQLEKETNNNLAHKVRVQKSTDDEGRQEQSLKNFTPISHFL